MLKTLRFISLIIAVLMLFGLQAPAQSFPQNLPRSFHRLNLDFGGGVTPTLGVTGNNLNTGWNITGGGGYNFTKQFGVIGQFMWDGLGVPNSVIQMFGTPGANAHIWGFTLNPRIRFLTSHRLGFYIIGGPGYYHRVLNLTRPTTQLTDVYCPFFGYLVPTEIPSNQVIGTVEKVGWGWNAGGGITYKLGSGATRLFVEARYHQISTSPRKTEILPITFGIRW